jgi:AsmA protein
VFRIVFRLFTLLVVLVVVLVGSLFLISGERLAKIAGDQITSMSGREVTLTGSLRPQLFPNLGVRTGAFEIAGTTGDVPLISGEALSVSVDLWALISRRIDVREITLVGPALNFVKDSDGRVNWRADSTGGTSSDGGSQPSEISLAALSIQDGSISYRDDAAGTDLLFERVNVTASMSSVEAPLTTSLTFVAGGQTASADIEIVSLPSLIAGEMTGVSLSSKIGQNTINYTGDASVDGRLGGDFAAVLPTPSALLALMGGAETSLSAEFLPIEVSGALAMAPDKIEVAGGSYRFGENQLQGPLSVVLTDVPFVSATLTTNALNLAFLSAAEGSASEPADGTGWSSDLIDASGVSLLDADISIEAASVDLGSTEMRDVSLMITIDNARAVAQIQRAQAFGGDLVGRFVVNNRNGLSVAGDMEGQTVAIQALLTDIAGFDRMRGAGNTELSFLGVGQSLDQIMRSLSGEGSLDIGQGDITGFDLASLFGGSDAVGDRATTIFQSLSASFLIRDGVLTNNDLIVSATLFEARGQGEIDLGSQRLDYVLNPRVFETDATRGLSIPVRIEGPWAKPRIYPDLKFVAKEKLRLEQNKIEADAKGRLEEERQKVEDKVRDKLENKLRQGLGSLFGD